MITVTCYFDDALFSEGECDTPEAALTCARTFWDDVFAAHPVQGASKATRFDFAVDGEHVRTVSGRRP